MTFCFFLASFSLLLLFVFELAEVEDLADRRIGVRADLHQIQTDREGALHRLAHGQNALHLTILIDQANLRDSDLLIYAGAVAGWRGGHWSSGYRSLLSLLKRSMADARGATPMTVC